MDHRHYESGGNLNLVLPFDSSRRNFLKLSAAILLLHLFPSKAKAYDYDDLSLFVERNGARHKIMITQNGELHHEGYLRLCYIFKDTKADSAVKMDPQLFIILAKGQKWLASYGYNGPIIITSAYRSDITNAGIEGAAKNSLHKYGRAADIKYPGLPISYLAVLFRTYGATGIGIYSTFLHIDTWKERAWIG